MELSQSEITRYLKLIQDRRYLFTLTAVIIMSVIVWGSYFIPKKYEAKSTMFIERNVIQELIKGIAITPSMSDRLRVLKDIMLGRSLVLSVLQRLDLDTRAENNKEMEEMIIQFQKKTNIRVRNNDLVTVSYVNKDPELAKNYVNNLVSMYVEKNIFAKREEAYDATRFLDRQVDFFKEKMDRSEKKIIKFRQEQGIFMAMDERAVISGIMNYKQQIEALSIRVNELIASKSSIENQLKKEKVFTVAMYSTSGIDGALKSLQTRLKLLLLRFTENYPEVIRVRAEIESLKKQQSTNLDESAIIQPESEISTANPVYQALKQKVIEIESEIKASEAREKDLKALIHKKQEELRNIPEDKKILGDMEKERDSFRGVYESLLERLGQSQVSKQMEIEDKNTTFRIIEPAILPKVPISPNRKLLILAGIFMGIIGGVGVIFLLDQTDSSIKTIDSLKTMGLPVLAIIPRMRNADELLKTRRKDIVLFSFTGLYMLCILAVLMMEIMDYTIIEDFISNLIIKETL